MTIEFNRVIPGPIPEYFSLREAKVSVRGSARIRGYSSEASLLFNSAFRASDCALARWIASGLPEGPFFFWGTASVGAVLGGDVVEFHRSCGHDHVEVMVCRWRVERSLDLIMLLRDFHRLDLVLKDCRIVEKLVMGVVVSERRLCIVKS